MTNFGKKLEKGKIIYENKKKNYIFFYLTHGGHFPKKYSKGPTI